MTPAQVAKLVAVLLSAYPHVRTNEGTSMAYERMLADLDHGAAQAAIERLLSSCKFLPTIAEIRETALAITVGEQKPGGEAWGSVLRAMKREGAYRSPGIDFVFADSVTAECVAALDWKELCLSENTVADRARFIELYDRLAVQSRRRELSDGLPAMQRFKASEAQKRLEQRTGTEGSNVFGRVLDIATGKDKP